MPPGRVGVVGGRCKDPWSLRRDMAGLTNVHAQVALSAALPSRAFGTRGRLFAFNGLLRGFKGPWMSGEESRGEPNGEVPREHPAKYRPHRPYRRLARPLRGCPCGRYCSHHRPRARMYRPPSQVPTAERAHGIGYTAGHSSVLYRRGRYGRCLGRFYHATRGDAC
jgi:hypothetical protein